MSDALNHEHGDSIAPRTLEGSREYMDRARQIIVRGVASAFRASTRPTPIVIERASGSRLIDIDGNSFIDYVGAFGPALLGHNPESLLARVTQQLPRGTLFGAQHVGELELAERIVEMVPSAEMVAFSNTGSEAVHAAIRIAKVATGRRRLVKFDGHYHGWIDPVYVIESLPVSEDVVVARWNDLDSLMAAIGDGEAPAAILMEPIPCNAGTIMPDADYLPLVREVCDRHGIVLIFDEVITGFRVAPGGAQEVLGVMPDLTVLAKALAGGFPLAMVAGRAALMRVAAEGPVQLVGTYNGNAVGVAAANALLEEVRHRGPLLYRQLNALGAQLADDLRRLAAQKHYPLEINQIGSILQLLWNPKLPVRGHDEVAGAEPAPIEALAEQLLLHGVYTRPKGLWYVSAAHTDEDLAATVAAAEQALETVGAVYG